MDVFNEYILDFWKACQTARLRYIMVGGFAINLHGYQRVTDDMDILIEDKLENCRKKKNCDSVIKKEKLHVRHITFLLIFHSAYCIQLCPGPQLSPEPF